jgi:hypothetical protein
VPRPSRRPHPPPFPRENHARENSQSTAKDKKALTLPYFKTRAAFTVPGKRRRAGGRGAETGHSGHCLFTVQSPESLRAAQGHP